MFEPCYVGQGRMEGGGGRVWQGPYSSAYTMCCLVGSHTVFPKWDPVLGFGGAVVLAKYNVTVWFCKVYIAVIVFTFRLCRQAISGVWYMHVLHAMDVRYIWHVAIVTALDQGVLCMSFKRAYFLLGTSV